MLHAVAEDGGDEIDAEVVDEVEVARRVDQPAASSLKRVSPQALLWY